MCFRPTHKGPRSFVITRLNNLDQAEWVDCDHKGRNELFCRSQI